MSAFGRNPLVRISDRVEAMVLVLAIIASMLGVPVGAAVGTAVHDSRSRIYAQQAQTRHTVTATVTGNSVSAAERTPTRHAEGSGKASTADPPSAMITVPAQWHAAGAQHSGAITVQPVVKAGDRIDIWVDNDGRRVNAPTPVALAAVQAILTALATWLGVTALAAGLAALVRLCLDRIRNAGWQHEIERLARQGGGRTTHEP